MSEGWKMHCKSIPASAHEWEERRWQCGLRSTSHISPTKVLHQSRLVSRLSKKQVVSPNSHTELCQCQTWGKMVWRGKKIGEKKPPLFKQHWVTVSCLRQPLTAIDFFPSFFILLRGLFFGIRSSLESLKNTFGRVKKDSKSPCWGKRSASFVAKSDSVTGMRLFCN